jgi:hypothetical protein
MSINGSKREFIFNLILMRNPALLSQIIAGSYRPVELERLYQRMYIDMYGWQTDNNVPVYVETQLSRADGVHFEKINRIIETIDQGIVMWIATEFKEEYLNALNKSLHFRMAKPIAVYLITFSDSYLHQMDMMNQLPQMEIWKRINAHQVELPVLRLSQSIKIMPSDYQGHTTESIADAITTVKGANKYFLRCLKERVPFFFNAHRSKDNLERRQIVFGAGRAGLELVVCLQTLNGECFFKLRLTNERHRPLFENMKKMVNEKVPYEFKSIDKHQVVFAFHESEIINRIHGVINQLEQVIVGIAPIIEDQNRKPLRYTKT